LIGSFCLTEPDVGSDASSVKTSAKRDGDVYILNGTKRYITNAPRAGTFTVMARTDPNKPGASGITAFIVDAKSDGITIGQNDKKMGQAGTSTSDVIFEDVKVPAKNIIGGVEGKGFYTSMKVLDRGRIHIAALSVGIAERLIKDALQFAIERIELGRHPRSCERTVESETSANRLPAHFGPQQKFVVRAKEALKGRIEEIQDGTSRI